MFRPLDFISRLVDKAFHDRKIVIVSEEKTKTILFSKNLQMISFVFLLVAMSMIPYMFGKISGMWNNRPIIGRLDIPKDKYAQLNVERRVEILQNDILIVQEYLKALHKYDNFVIYDEKAGQSDSKKNSNDNLTLLEDERNNIMSELNRKALNRIYAIETFLDSAGLDYKKITGKDAPDSAKGGPFIPASTQDMIDSGAGTYLSNEFVDQLNYLYDLQKILDSLPFSIPIGYSKISSYYGVRKDPFNGRHAMHAGMDLAGLKGSYISAAGPGTVTFVGKKGAYGLMIEIDHGYGFKTRYGHLAEAKVKEGSQVARAQIIAVQGCSGRCTGDHLHYEVRIDDKTVNPITYLSRASKIQYYYAKKI